MSKNHVMERKVGEVFDFDGVKLRVERADDETSCNGCYFRHTRRSCFGSGIIPYVGRCNTIARSDKESVIFVEVEDDKYKEE